MELSQVEFAEPESMLDWIVRVSEHCGFPRWDGPTEAAFEEATWAYEGPLAEAMAGLGIQQA